MLVHQAIVELFQSHLKQFDIYIDEKKSAVAIQNDDDDDDPQV